MMWRADRASPLNFLFAVELFEPLEPSVLNRGLEHVVQSRPVLGMTVGLNAGGRPVFTPANTAPVVRCRDELPWNLLCQEQLNLPFSCPGEPVVRLFLCGVGRRHLVIVFQHCFGDGTSGLLILRELLEACASHCRGEALIPARKPWGPPVEQRLLREVEDRAAFTRFGHRLQDNECSLALRKTIFLPELFLPEATNALVMRARRQGVSVHGLLAACQLQTVAAELGEPSGLSLSSPYSLRGRLDPSVGEGVGLFIGDARHEYWVDPESDPWELAAAITRDVGREARSGGAMSAPPEDLASVYRARASTAISNLGRFSLGQRVAPIGVRAVHFGVACSVLGDQIGAVVTTSGHLSWCFCGMSPTMTIARMERIRGAWRSRIDALV